MESFETWESTLLLGIELLATLAFALSGIMEAARKRMDVVGVSVVGFLAAFGGGTLRDIFSTNGLSFGWKMKLSCGRCWRCAFCPLASCVKSTLN
jgi:uncharacterized membrane protein YeiH